MGLAVAAVDIFGVQQLMRQMAVRLAQELRVELLDIRVFVGLADQMCIRDSPLKASTQAERRTPTF